MKLSPVTVTDLNKYIKDKVDNITLKDIKDKGSELIEGIYESIMKFKQKLLSYNN